MSNATTTIRTAEIGKEGAAIPATAKAGKAAAPREVPPLKANALVLAEMKNNAWVGIAAAESEPEDYLDHAIWASIPTGANNGLSRFDRIILTSPTWWAELLVLEAEAGFVSVKVLRSTELPPRISTVQKRIPAGYEVRRGEGAEEPWVVVRKSDGWIVNQDHHHQREEDAIRWIQDHPIFRSAEAVTYLP